MSATRAATQASAAVSATVETRAVAGNRARSPMPAASGSATTSARLAMMPAGLAPERPASSRRTGPATITVVSVEPISTPADSAASPPAIAVVATEAISHGASPTASTPSRSGPAGATWEAAQDSSGSTVTPVTSAAARERHATAIRLRAAGSIVTAVASTSTASRALMPWWRASQASGDWTVSPIAAATTTAASSGYRASTGRIREMSIRRLEQRGRRDTVTG